MGARWYDPRLGRWISADTIAPNPDSPQSLNRFSYVLGNPLKFIDPSGHKEEGECGFNGEACHDEPDPLPEDVILQILQGMKEDIYDPGRTDPIIIELGPGQFFVIMPVGSNPFQTREGALEPVKKAAWVPGVAGLVLDGIEAIALIGGGAVGIADISAGADFLAAGIGSLMSGDMWINGRPHPDLPAMWLAGQDVMLTGGDLALPWLVGGGIGAITWNAPAGVATKAGTDFVTTALSISYDFNRLTGQMPTLINAGLSFQEGRRGSYMLLYP
jgi:hypothetical protein